MSKPILIAFLVILLTGSGVVFANTELSGDLPGFYSEFVENVAGTNDAGTNDAGTNDDGTEVEETGDNKSDVAKAVHDALTGDENDGDENGLKPGDEGFGQAVADRAKDPDVHLGQEVSEAARNANGSAVDGDDANGETGDNKSDVAKAVHDALTGDENDGDENGLKPGDEGFGQAVSDRAKDPDVHLGQEVSNAARNANGSLDTDSEENDDGTIDNGTNDDGSNGDETLIPSDKTSSPGNSGNTGYPFNSDNGGSPGNSGNAGGGGSPGNSGNAGGGGKGR